MSRKRLMGHALVFWMVAAPAFAQDSIRTVLLSARPSPGLPAGGLTSWFDPPRINDVGQVVVRGGSAIGAGGVTGNNDESLWIEQAPGDVRLAVREGAGAPGFPATGSNRATIGCCLWDYELSNNGKLVVIADLSAFGVNHAVWDGAAVWTTDANGALQMIAHRNRRPATPNDTLRQFNDPAINSLGQIAFGVEELRSSYSPPESWSIWRTTAAGELETVAVQFYASPGLPADRAYSLLESNIPELNDRGDVAFSARLRSLTATPLPDSGDDALLVLDRNGSLRTVAREGDFAPGTTSPFNTLYGAKPLLNHQGQVAFLANLVDPGTGEPYPYPQGYGLWSEGSGNGLKLVVRSGDQVPGEAAGVRFKYLLSPELNSAGQVAFNSYLDETSPGVNDRNDSGLWLADAAGEIQQVVREGMHAPGFPADVHFGNFDQYQYTVNNAGQMLFLAGLLSGPQHASLGTSLWATDRLGALRFIAREGDFLDVDDGPGQDWRRIQFLGVADDSHNDGGHTTGFNDLGQAAFWASFQGGTSGVFVSNLVAVPEPHSALACFIAALGSTCLARRQRLARS